MAASHNQRRTSSNWPQSRWALPHCRSVHSTIIFRKYCRDCFRSSEGCVMRIGHRTSGHYTMWPTRWRLTRWKWRLRLLRIPVASCRSSSTSFCRPSNRWPRLYWQPHSCFRASSKYLHWSITSNLQILAAICTIPDSYFFQSFFSSIEKLRLNILFVQSPYAPRHRLCSVGMYTRKPFWWYSYHSGNSSN